jgi:hypothetical protein
MTGIKSIPDEQLDDEDLMDVKRRLLQDLKDRFRAMFRAEALVAATLLHPKTKDFFNAYQRSMRT